MAYSEITNAEIDQDSPITQPLMTKMRDNPLSILAGDSGYMNAAAWVPVDWTFSDRSGDGTIYDFLVDGIATQVDYTLENGWEYMFLIDAIHGDNSNTPRVDVKVSQDAGSSFSSTIVNGDTTVDEVRSYNIVYFRNPRLDNYAKEVFLFRQGGGLNESRVTGNAIDQVRFAWSGGQDLNNDDADEGSVIRAFRRREYFTAS